MGHKAGHQDDLSKYAKALGLFLIFITISLMIFFYGIQQKVERNIRAVITNNVERQRYHLSTIIEVQYGYLESIAAYFSDKETLDAEENIELLRAVYEGSTLERLAVFDSDGTATYDTGEKKQVANRDYFIEAMQGHRWLSDPLESIVDGKTRVILSVPIWREDEVIGVLGGSYDVGMLSHVLFEDIYDGAGYCLIVTGDGTIVSYDGDPQFRKIQPEDNFFEYYSRMKFSGGTSLQKIKEDFAAKQTGCVKFSLEDDVRYISYAPLGLNDWVMCYVVPLRTAQNDYQFIQHYEVLLFTGLVAAIVILLFYFFRVNTRSRRALLRDAQEDSLTGVYNKKSAEERIESYLASGQQKGMQVLLMLDIDKFKEINDVYGHPAGDEVLRNVGALLQRQFRGDDIIGRIGGDEFIILMKNCNGEADVSHKAEELCKMFRELRIPEWPEIRLTCSMGLSFAPEHGNTYRELYRSADQALYQTKQRGRDGYTCLGREARQ